MTTTKIALDPNVILYALDQEESDRKFHALTLFQNSPYFSSQTFSEVINVCRKRWKFNKDKLIRIADFLLEPGRRYDYQISTCIDCTIPFPIF